MDPAVIAALITTPTAVLAAVTAYAAGRAQGRGTVDAVRRQHQRDAYAAFLSAAISFADQMDWRRCVALATRETAASTHPESAEAVRRLAAGIRAAVDIKPMQDASMLVHLEGPKHVSQLVITAMNQARKNQEDAETAIQDTPTAPGTFALPDPEKADYAFSRRVGIFMAAASAHLNGDDALAAEARASASISDHP
ncbi:hypothetical protein BJ965_004161 [Streptomyces luteogriseus]|uniref:Uncharacterized protein n=1 Tax=Streptomyces luteogriseus TaxID=68233 RepID=A0A7W7DNY9_9ACTN|nr:hypothetical protein [Streptomyces luteogriseus]MBB4714279.1 hypothetical protein [Streptomyces luteogriseus]